MIDPVYLFAYFLGKSESGTHLAFSEDGLRWKPLSDKPIIRPASGLMRDPFLYPDPDNGFHLLWTTDWESQDIGYAYSEDLLNWSPQRRLPVMQGIEGARNCWAPEMVYDADRKEFLIFWASTVVGRFEETTGSSETDYNHRMWRARTPDFSSFSEPSVYFDPGFNVIDATLLKTDSETYTLIAKNETLQPEAKDLFYVTSSTPAGPFSSPSKPFTQSWVEGPSALRLGSYTYVFFDRYLEKRYGAVRTKDFETWEDASHLVDFPEGARHGSILSISRDTFDALVNGLKNRAT